MNKVSRVTNGLIRHPLLERARDEFIPLCRDTTDGLVLLLLGPTQSGKSIIFQELLPVLRSSFVDTREGAIPVIDLQIENVSDGRTKPKWIVIELLKALKHPMYTGVGCLHEGGRYFPSRGRDESSLRHAVKEAFAARFNRRTCLDEFHLLTRTRNDELRGAILESIKSTTAIDRSLIACGGYEIAYKGLFDSPHFCGRVITFDFGHYQSSNPSDVDAWDRILKTYSGSLDLSPKSLLNDEANNLLHWSNGTVGLLDKHLWSCKVMAKAHNTPIDKKILHACAPPERERRAIAQDIKNGIEALRSSSPLRVASQDSSPSESSDGTNSSELKKSSTKADLRPFERRPNRHASEKVEIYDDD